MRSEGRYSYIRTVKADLFRYRRATGLRGFLKCYLRKPGFRYTFWMRTASHLRDHPFLKVFYWVARLQLRRLQIRFGISIPHTVSIGPGLFIGHFGGIVVNERVSMGENCNLSHGVTIGQKNRGKHKGCPTIENMVYLGSGSCILGGISIGSNVAVGAHAVVVHDVSDNEVVAGNPARKISEAGSNGYVNWILDDGERTRESSEYETNRI